MPLVQVADLDGVKVLQVEIEPHVEGRLVHVRDQEIRLRGDDHHGVEPVPPLVGGPAVVPGANQGEEILVESRLQQPIRLVQGQDDGGVSRGQNIVLHQAGQPVLWSQRATPQLFYFRHIEPEFADGELGQVAHENVGRLQVVLVNTLEVKADVCGPMLTRVVHTSHQERTLARLAGSTDRRRSTRFHDLALEMGVSVALNVEFVAQLNRPTWRF